jgi:ABC-2 type transport system ATP-binding protein
MIKAINLTKKYNNVTVLDIPDIEINSGEILGLVGNNGAGKTTFFRLILDLIRASEGEVFSKGETVKGSEDWKHYTGSFLDEGFLIDYLTPEEYFNFLANINGLSKADMKEFILKFKEFFNDEILGKKKFIRDLSKGNQKKVGIAAALMSNPDIIILDEPYESLDPTTQIRLTKMIKEFQKNSDKTILISSHDLNHVAEVSTRIVILEKGKVVHDLQKSEETLKTLESYFNV